MARRASTTLVGVCADQDLADRAVRELRRAGFRGRQLSVITAENAGQEAARAAARVRKAKPPKEGSVAGGVAGGILGGVIGAAAALIPGAAPVVAAGVAAGVLGTAAAGATAGGLLGALVGLGVAEEEARRYEQELAAGRTLVLVRCRARREQAATILQLVGSPTHRSATAG